jgi:hypothetical protein
MENKPIKLLPLRSYSYRSPARPKRAPVKPNTPRSPNYSPARPVLHGLLFRNSIKELGLNMRGKGGTLSYLSPEEIEKSKQKNTIEETERERALKIIYNLTFDPDFIDRWEAEENSGLGGPEHDKLTELKRVAAGERPKPPISRDPPPAPLKLLRLKPIKLENNVIHEESPITAPVASVPPPIAKQPPPAPTKKRPRPKDERKRKTRRLKNRRHK